MSTQIQIAVLKVLTALALLPIVMAVYAVIFTVSYRVFVSDDLLAGWHYAWSNPVTLAAFTVVAMLLRASNSAVLDRRSRR
jgi:hypothetical protein